MKTKIRNWLAAAGIAAAALEGAVGCSSSKAAAARGKFHLNVTAAVVPVKREALSNDLQITSEFIPYQSIDVDAEVSGYVKRLYINWGTRVRAGQLMAVLDVPQLNAVVQRDQASAARDQNDLLRAQRMLARAKATYFVNNITYKRYTDVLKTNPALISQEELDIAHGNQLKAAAGVSAAQAAAAASQQALAATKATLARDQALYQYSFIRAPFDGVVTKLNGYTGALLPAGTSNSTASLPLCHLSQLNLLRLVIPVPGEVVQDVHLGEAVEVNVPSLHRVFQGKISVLAGQINFETRTEHVEVWVPNPSFVLVPGMYAYVNLPIRSAAHALAVPIQAVSMGEQGTTGTVLLVNAQDRIEQRKVQLGIQTAYDVQVVSGLRAGDRIVFGDQTQYHAGESVHPQLANLASLGAARK